MECGVEVACARFVVQSSTGKGLVQALQCKVVLGNIWCKLCTAKCSWEVPCANFVVQSSTGKYFVQTLPYKVVLGGALWKLSSTK